MKMKDYQEKAVRDLFEKSMQLLSEGNNKKMVFKSPTGSGKTIMMAELLARLANAKRERPLSFVWTAPRKLHGQSYDKLQNYYTDSMSLDCAYFEELTDKKIGENQILFLNWESIRRRDTNVIVRENEQDFYLEKVIEHTKEEERDVILLIDESHHHATSEISRNLISDIAPMLTIEISATPIMEDEDERVRVSLEEVKDAGMIKESILINDGLKNQLGTDGGTLIFPQNTDDFVLQQALNKQAELVAAYKEINVNPLLCIQLPDHRTAQDENIKIRVIEFLKGKGITKTNEKLAVWLSNEQENLDNISHNDSESKVLIFKQAIALGWDCPRAQILVLFRDVRSIVFSVQTLGRIMRMPEPEVGYYEKPILNKSYVYTNMPSALIKEDMSDGYIRTHATFRINDYEPLKLPSVHRIRQREQTRLAPLFIKLFLKEAGEYGLAKKIQLRGQKAQLDIISDYQVSEVDGEVGTIITGDEKVSINDEADLQKNFDSFVRHNLSPFYPEDRSIARVKEAIYEFFNDSLHLDYVAKFVEIMHITLSENNKQHFINVMEVAKQQYQQEVATREEGLQMSGKWEVPENIDYGVKYVEHPVQKSVLKPFYASVHQSEPERQFIDFLEGRENVKWWYKNGEGDSFYFAVPYTENEKENPFYVDFVVHFADGRIGLYDTKKGFTVQTAPAKSDGLLAYIAKNAKSRKVTGGIVTPSGNAWMVYKGKGEDLDSNNLSNWEILDI